MATAVTFKIGAPATITIDLGTSFPPSDDKVRAIVQNALYPQFVKVSKVGRRWGSENFTITFLPRRSMSAREWESLFTKTLRAGGYSSAYVVDLTGGAESSHTLRIEADPGHGEELPVIDYADVVGKGLTMEQRPCDGTGLGGHIEFSGKQVFQAGGQDHDGHLIFAKPV